jgi:hypothetical protein
MSDSGTEPTSPSRAGSGVELMFIFTLPALMIVGAIAAMAATGYWWLMGVAFVGALIATALVATTIFHYTGDADETSSSIPATRATPAPAAPVETTPRRRHHRLAWHH